MYALTVAWMLQLVHRHRRLAHTAGAVAAAGLLVEIVVITLQAARGAISHYVNTSPLDGALFALMGVAIASVWVATGVLALVLLGEEVPGAGLATGLHWGLGISVLAMLAGMLMIDPVHGRLQAAVGGPETAVDGGHSVGALDGGPGLPVLGWSTGHGDLRVGHFLGLHALQLLPLLGWLLDQRTAPARAHGLTRVAGAGWLAVVLIALGQAATGESVVRPSGGTLVAVGALVVALIAGVAVVLRRTTTTRVPEPADR